MTHTSTSPARRPLRVGIIGCGWASEHGHLPALARTPQLEVVAIAGKDPARLNRLGDSFGIARRYHDHLALLDDPSVDAAGVCVPAEAHVEVALSCAEAEIPVLLEKPPALDLDEWDRLAAAVRAAGVTFMLGVNMRWHRGFRAARSLIQAGALGDIQCIRSALANDEYLRPGTTGWRDERRRGGGALVETAVHHFDLWRFLGGADVEEVFALSEGRDESLVVAGRLRSGVPVCGLFSWRSAHVNEIEVYGDAGRLRASPYTPPVVLGLDRQPWTRRGKLAEVYAAVSPPHAVRGRREGGFFVASFAAQWRQFAAAVRRRDPPEPELASARSLLQAVLAAAASANEGRAVRCDEAPATLAS